MPSHSVRRTGAAALASLAMLAGGLVTTEAQAYRDWGRTSAPDGTLRKGCHDYPFRYVVDPPRNDWMAEIFLVDPSGENLASYGADSASEDKYNRGHWRICRPSTRPGRFKIRMRITWYDGSETYAGWVRPSYFRLRRP